jgi:aspartate aminotransferase-like enzyme
MDEALAMLEAEGQDGIFARHAACAAAARAGLAALGFRLFADPAHASKTVTSAWMPEGTEWSALNREMRARGLVVAGGQDRLTGQIMRIGHLGDVDVDQVAAAIEVIGEASVALGREVDVTGAVDAAREAATAVSGPERTPEAVAAGA